MESLASRVYVMHESKRRRYCSCTIQSSTECNRRSQPVWRMNAECRRVANVLKFSDCFIVYTEYSDSEMISLHLAGAGYGVGIVLYG